MQKTIGSLVLIGFFILGTLIVIFSANGMDKSTSKQPEYNPQAQADWPVYEFDEVMEDIESHPLSNTDYKYTGSKLATLNLDEVLYTSSSNISRNNDVLLHQAVEFVNPGESYLMFLAKRGDYYYEVDGNSKPKLENEKYEVFIPNIEGEYTKQEFIEKFNLKLKDK